MVSCVKKFKELAGVKDARPYPTPFITEDHATAPAGQAGTGPCVECPWCFHTFPSVPNTYKSVEDLEAAKEHFVQTVDFHGAILQKSVVLWSSCILDLVSVFCDVHSQSAMRVLCKL